MRHPARRLGFVLLALAGLLLVVGCGEPGPKPAASGTETMGIPLVVRLTETGDGSHRVFARLAPPQVVIVDAEQAGRDDLLLERMDGRCRLGAHATRNRMPIGSATAAQAKALAKDPGAWSRDTLAPAARAAGIAVKEGDATYWRPTPMPLSAGALLALRASGEDVEGVRALLFVEAVSEDGELRLRFFPRPE